MTSTDQWQQRDLMPNASRVLLRLFFNPPVFPTNPSPASCAVGLVNECPAFRAVMRRLASNWLANLDVFRLHRYGNRTETAEAPESPARKARPDWCFLKRIVFIFISLNYFIYLFALIFCAYTRVIHSFTHLSHFHCSFKPANRSAVGGAYGNTD